MAERVQISHFYTTGNSAPDTTDLIYGELALSLSSGNETINFKNNNNKIALFSSDEKFLKQKNVFSGNTTFNNNVMFNSGVTFAKNTTFNSGITLGNSRVTSEITCINGLIIRSPQPLTINGIVNISGNTKIVGSCTSTGGFFDTSDERLKIFENDISINLEDIKNIKKTYFYYKSDNKKEKHIGVSAQDIEKLYPEIINVNNDGYLTVDYSKLSVIALKAIDVLSEENKTLKIKLTDLEKRLEILENK